FYVVCLRGRLALGQLRRQESRGPIEVGLSWQRILAVLSVLVLTWINLRGVRTAALIQTSLTAVKTLSLAALIVLGFVLGLGLVAGGEWLRWRGASMKIEALRGSYVPPALTAAGLDWRIVYTSPSLAGAQAAVRAGLGITVLPEAMVPADFNVLGPDHGLPDLAETEIALMARSPLSRPAALLRGQLIAALEQPAQS
ncbi:MAG: hypothetical protein HC779_08630, partial [Phyllobacteriaceae bacterium]|nr:hypothetical protein [Phyllobacteriaceae bacterium]